MALILNRVDFKLLINKKKNEKNCDYHIYIDISIINA